MLKIINREFGKLYQGIRLLIDQVKCYLVRLELPMSVVIIVCAFASLCSSFSYCCHLSLSK